MGLIGKLLVAGKVVVGLGLGWFMLALLGQTPLGYGFAAFAFVLVMITRKFTFVWVGTLVAILFFVGVGIERYVELLIPNPVVRYVMIFFVGVVLGQLEDRVMNVIAE